MNNAKTAVYPGPYATANPTQFPAGFPAATMPANPPTLKPQPLTVPSFVGQRLEDIDDSLRYLNMYTVDDLMNGIPIGEDNQIWHTPLNRDQLTFMWNAAILGRLASFDESPPGLMDGSEDPGTKWVVASQSVRGGSAAAEGSGFTLNFVEEPG
jgi:hypothetical protein